MADNYIERQQEQYEARKAAWKQAQKYGKKKTTTSSQVKTEVAGEIVSKSDSLKKRIFVTGGAEGIGRAIVEAFCKDGHQVAFCDINAVSGQQTARDTGAIFHPVDVSDKEALESCMQQILDEWTLTSSSTMSVSANFLPLQKQVSKISTRFFPSIFVLYLLLHGYLPFIVRHSLILILMEESLISAQHVI